MAMDPKGQSKAALVTREGLFELMVLAINLRKVPATLKRLVGKLLAELKFYTCLY